MNEFTISHVWRGVTHKFYIACSLGTSIVVVVAAPLERGGGFVRTTFSKNEYSSLSPQSSSPCEAKGGDACQRRTRMLRYIHENRTAAFAKAPRNSPFRIGGAHLFRSFITSENKEAKRKANSIHHRGRIECGLWDSALSLVFVGR
jgi:hypothetical protein